MGHVTHTHYQPSLSALTTRLRWWPRYESSLLPRHLSSSRICWGPCDAGVSQLRTRDNSLSPEREESATVHAASVLPHHLSGTVYGDTSETMTLVVNNSLAIWRHFCLHRPIRQRHLWERLFKRRSIIMDLLTYLGIILDMTYPDTKFEE